MRMYVKDFLRHMADAILAAICVVACVYLYYVFYIVFSCLIH